MRKPLRHPASVAPACRCPACAPPLHRGPHAGGRRPAGTPPGGAAGPRRRGRRRRRLRRRRRAGAPGLLQHCGSDLVAGEGPADGIGTGARAVDQGDCPIEGHPAQASSVSSMATVPRTPSIRRARAWGTLMPRSWPPALGWTTAASVSTTSPPAARKTVARTRESSTYWRSRRSPRRAGHPVTGVGVEEPTEDRRRDEPGHTPQSTDPRRSISAADWQSDTNP